MAANLQQLRRRIKTSKNIAQIAKAMEMISASKIKRAQNAVESNRPYAEKIMTLTSNLLGTQKAQTFSHPYIHANSSPKNLLIAVSSDKGLCGALNTNLIKKLYELESPDTFLITLGKKIEMTGARTKCELIASYPMGTSLPSYSHLYDLIALVQDYIENNKAARVDILYTSFQSLFSQIPQVKRILPIVLQENQAPVESGTIIEPSVGSILSKLIPHYFEVELYQALIEAYTSEQAARMVSMQNAKNNALDIADYLTLRYNKSRQERITNEILDVANNIQ